MQKFYCVIHYYIIPCTHSQFKQKSLIFIVNCDAAKKSTQLSPIYACVIKSSKILWLYKSERETNFYGVFFKWKHSKLFLNIREKKISVLTYVKLPSQSTFIINIHTQLKLRVYCSIEFSNFLLHLLADDEFFLPIEFMAFGCEAF